MPSSRLLPFQSTHPSGVRPGSANVSAVRPSISIHAPQWGATSLSWDHQSSRQFQSTHPSGVRLPFAVGTKAASSFQSTHPSGVRRVSGGDGRGGGSISIHAPQWGATGRVEIDEVAVNHFNPRTPVGCDRPTRTRVICLSISIHAPQWGATNNRYQTGVHESISIHAPQWGATSTTIRVPRPPNYFNPRTPVGCDGRQGARLPVLRISIHAPQWGATSPSVSKLTPDPDFNPRTPVGCDRTRWHTGCRSAYFNPRTPVGCDWLRPAYRL